MSNSIRIYPAGSNVLVLGDQPNNEIVITRPSGSSPVPPVLNQDNDPVMNGDDQEIFVAE